MLKLKGVSECFYPETIEEAVKLLKEGKDSARIIGGGLHIAAFPNPLIRRLIFLNNLHLNYVKENEGRVAIGATTTISELINSGAINYYNGYSIKKVLQSIATELLRNQITIGGSVAQNEPYSDIVTLLAAIRARVLISSGDRESEIPLKEFYAGNFRETLKHSIIKEIVLEKKGEDFRFGMERFVKNATEIPLLNMGILVQLSGDTVKDATIVTGARPGEAEFFTEGEEYLKGRQLSEKNIEIFADFVEENINVDTDIRLSKEYRAHIAGVFAKRILTSFLREV